MFHNSYWSQKFVGVLKHLKFLCKINKFWSCYRPAVIDLYDFIFARLLTWSHFLLSLIYFLFLKINIIWSSPPRWPHALPINSSLPFLNFRKIFKEVEHSGTYHELILKSELEPSLFDVVEVIRSDFSRNWLSFILIWWLRGGLPLFVPFFPYRKAYLSKFLANFHVLAVFVKGLVQDLVSKVLYSLTFRDQIEVVTVP